METLYSLKDEVSKMLLERIGITPVKSTLKLYTYWEWVGITPSSRNLAGYEAATFTAHLPKDHQFSEQFLYHEYFGHGLHTEHTQLGEDKHTLNLKLQKGREAAGINPEGPYFFENLTPEEKSIADRIEDLLTTEEQRKSLQKTKIPCEGLALWTQWYISKLRGKERQFEELIALIPKPEKEEFMKYKKYSQMHGEKKLLKDCGYRIP